MLCETARRHRFVNAGAGPRANRTIQSESPDPRDKIRT